DIEEVFLAHPAIREVAVIGVRGSAAGAEHRIVTFAAGSTDLKPEEVARHCRGLLPTEKLPDQVFFMSQLPKTGTGKIDRPRPAAMVEQHAATHSEQVPAAAAVA